MLVLEEVAVAVESGGDRAVPEVPLDGLGMRSLRDASERPPYWRSRNAALSYRIPVAATFVMSGSATS